MDITILLLSILFCWQSSYYSLAISKVIASLLLINYIYCAVYVGDTCSITRKRLQKIPLSLDSLWHSDLPQAGNSSETVEETGRTDDTGSGSVEEAGRVYVYGSTLGTTDISEAGLFALYVEVGPLYSKQKLQFFLNLYFIKYNNNCVCLGITTYSDH